ncbi:MAG: hypothetical protein B1H13_14690 [Desulfobacteraceae bacterium 4484_190.3]|nr:MAG: hypothetical protein B1H13_14690 [Desulfobacteraceae bacterium 4484_190.3]
MSLKKEIKFFIIKHFLTFPAYYILNLYAKIIRLRFENEEEIKNRLENNGRVILASWHQRFFGGFYLPKILGRPICIMISQSKDGDFIADVVKRVGWIPVRGSSSRGGKKALKGMVDEISKTQLAGHIVDGPTGPPRVIKPGLISMAQQSKSAICPTCVFYDKPWIFNSWDRFMVPRPFSSVVIRFGSLEFVPENMNSEEFEENRLYVERKMIEEYEKEDQYWNKKSGLMPDNS